MQFNMSVPEQLPPHSDMDLNATDDIFLQRPTDWNDVGRRKDLRIASRSRLVYATMDSTFDMAHLASALRLVLAFNASREQSPRASAAAIAESDAPVDPRLGGVAVGVLTMLTFSEVQEELRKADVEPTALDFIVCSSGAYIMYVDVEGQWVADEAWEERVCHRWDKKLVVRTCLCACMHACVFLSLLDINLKPFFRCFTDV
jgi:hypothetical protein